MAGRGQASGRRVGKVLDVRTADNSAKRGIRGEHSPKKKAFETGQPRQCLAVSLFSKITFSHTAYQQRLRLGSSSPGKMRISHVIAQYG